MYNLSINALSQKGLQDLLEGKMIWEVVHKGYKVEATLMVGPELSLGFLINISDPSGEEIDGVMGTFSSANELLMHINDISLKLSGTIIDEVTVDSIYALFHPAACSFIPDVLEDFRNKETGSERSLRAA